MSDKVKEFIERLSFGCPADVLGHEVGQLGGILKD